MESEIFRWAVFHLLIAFLLVIDFGVFHRKRHKVTLREGLGWTLFWIALSMGFNLFIYFHDGTEKALQFFTGYLVEKSLSVDNLFVFLVVFTYFKVPARQQYHILYVGIIFAVLLRLSLILLGISLIEHFQWMIYLFGLLIGVTGARFIFEKKHKMLLENSYVVQLVRKWFPKISQLMLVSIVIEVTDVVFALDSIPAIFAITVDPYIVYTSNVFAMLGLRSLYFVLAEFYDRFVYLKFGLGAILILVGIEIVLKPVYPIPLPWTLGAIVAILAAAIVASFSKKSLT